MVIVVKNKNNGNRKVESIRKSISLVMKNSNANQLIILLCNTFYFLEASWAHSAL
jgi:dihydroxyacetone kinase-like predicted kinase